MATQVVSVTLPPPLLDKFKKQFELFGAGDQFANTEYWEYIHVFRNQGPRKIDLGFPDQDTFSPLFSAMRGFSLTIPASKERTVRFIATSKPQESVATMLVAVRYGKNKWLLSGGGVIAMYIPIDRAAFSDKNFLPENKRRKAATKNADLTQKK